MERSGVVRDGRVPVNLTTADLNCTELESDCGNEVSGRKVIVHDPLASWNGIEFGDLLARADMARVEPLLDFSSDNVRCRNSSFFLPGNGDVPVNAHALCSNNAVSESQGGSVKETTEGAMEEKIHFDQTLNSAASITTLDEQPRPDKGEEQISDLNATPQQKAKRRKHRPKVVTEGKAKVARKEMATVSTPKSTEGIEKRKYAREKKSDDADNKTSKRKYVRKKVPPKSSSTATAKGRDMADDKDNKISKRKYVRKKVPPKSSSTAADEGGEMSELDGCKKTKKSCRKVLDFDSDSQRPTPGIKENPIVLSDSDTEQEQLFSKTSGGRKCIQRKQLEGGRKGNYNNLSHSVDAMGQGQTRVCNGKYSFARTYQQLSKNGFKHTPARVKLVHHKGDEHSSITSIASSTTTNARNNEKLVKEWWHCNPKSSPASDTTVRVSISSEIEVTDTGPAQDANTEISSAPDFPVNQASLNDSLEEEVKPCTTLIDSKDCARLAGRNRLQKRKLNHISQSQRADTGQLITGSNSIPIARHIDAIWEYLISVDDIVERLKALDINRETNNSYQQCNTLVPFDKRYGKKHIHNSHRNQREDRTQLVIYNHNGTLIPFDNSQNKKRRPRAKVDLDEETSKVWRLLLENINSQGVDGTDEEKARWWENERKVFSGRANSFIARMHLVQGDRRFSKWKGSVVDSVVGVFLTQNVSDHLSSSAFMSLAARFPLKPNPNDKQYHKDVGCGASTVQVTHPEDSVPLNSNISNNPISDQVSSASNSEHIEQKAVSSEGASNSGAMSSTDESVCKNSALESEPQKIVETAGIQLNGNDAAEMSCIAEHQQSQSDEVISSQSSATTYQSSMETLPSQTSERNMDFDPAAVSLPQANGGSTTFSQLLQMVGCVENQRGSLPCFNIETTAKDVQNREDGVRLRDQLRNEMDKSRDSTSASIELGVQQKEGTAKSSLMVHVDEDLIEVGKRGFRSLSSTTNLTDTESIESSKVPKVVNKTYSSDRAFYESNIKSLKEKRRRVGKDIDHRFDWEGLRKETRVNGETRGKTPETMDSLDYEAVRSAEVNDIAYTIRERGMNNVLAGRIKDFLNRLVNEHGSIDLEWLRDVPPDQAKEYLLSIRGLGLKSVECVRLLTLHHLAFPVDTNVGRIAVRLGWVPLQPLPESLQLHLLEMYPVQESIQKYLWPRLCKLDQKTLYELHYQMITFGKVFCTKSKPNCNSCPMRGECRHFASAFASARLALPGPEEKRIVPSTEQRESFVEVPEGLSGQVPLLPHIVCPKQDPSDNLQITQSSKSQSRVTSSEPIIEEPKSPECVQIEEKDIEDCCYEESDEIPEIKLNIEEFTQSLQNYLHENTELEEGDVSRALIALTPEAASIPLPKLKNVSMLRTEHHVYELPDSHPLLEGLDKREPDDPCSYLLAIWTPGETANSVQPPEPCTSSKTDKLCDKETCFSCNSSREANSHTVRGTLLIPCRTAMRGSFPLNGTYFQVNEVFADHDSSLSPMNIPRKWLWNLPRRTVYFGTSIPTIFKGLSTEGIQQCFWRGYVCVRGFDQKNRAPRPLLARLHFPASKLSRTKGKPNGE